MKKKKKKGHDLLSYNFRLKTSKDNFKLINHLSRNSKALFNTGIYYSNKILNKERDFMEKYNQVLNKYKVKKNKYSENGLSLFMSNTYDNYKYMNNHSSQQTIKRVHKCFKSYFSLLKKRADGELDNNYPINSPKYLKKNYRFNVFFTKYSFKKCIRNGKYCVRFTLGDYIQNNYSNFIKCNHLVKLNKEGYYSKLSNMMPFKDVINYENKINAVKKPLTEYFKSKNVKINRNNIMAILRVINSKDNIKCVNLELNLDNYLNEKDINQIKNIINNTKIIDLPNDKIYKIINKEYFSYKNKYISKNDNNLINGMYMYIQIPKIVYDKEINEIEIKPNYNGLTYSILYKYIVDYPNVLELPENDKFRIIKSKYNDFDKIKPLSIDLGVNNLMTCFTLTTKPIIINGRPIKSINQFYNKKISKLQSQKDNHINRIKKNVTTHKLKRWYHFYNTKINRLFDNRTKKIRNLFHVITTFLVKSCKENNVNLVILGYTKGWKNKVNIGKINNQNFVDIPYLQLKSMLSYKLRLNKIKLMERNESYTSKCDSLANERVGWHKKYSGKRVHRGLFQSKKGYKLNADVNAAINIFRKVFNVKRFSDYLLKNIKTLLNPVKITFNKKSNVPLRQYVNGIRTLLPCPLLEQYCIAPL